jgi:hypothetical protein
MATESEKTAPSRSELERIAFGRAQTPDEIAAAESALKLLVADDEAHAAAAQAVATTPEPEQPVVEPETSDAALDTRASRPRPRSVVPLVVAVGLLAALILGVVLSHQAVGTPTSARHSGTATVSADAAAALKSLLVTQTAADKSYPLPGYSAEMSIQPASIHRILTSSDGATLWTGRTDNDLCLMWTGTDPTATIGAGIACAAPRAFDAGGLRLTEGITSWTWNGTAFTTTVRNSSALAPW